MESLKLVVSLSGLNTRINALNSKLCIVQSLKSRAEKLLIAKCFENKDAGFAGAFSYFPRYRTNLCTNSPSACRTSRMESFEVFFVGTMKISDFTESLYTLVCMYAYVATVESEAEPSTAALDDEDNDHVINLTPSAVRQYFESYFCAFSFFTYRLSRSWQPTPLYLA